MSSSWADEMESDVSQTTLNTSSYKHNNSSYKRNNSSYKRNTGGGSYKRNTNGGGSYKHNTNGGSYKRNKKWSYKKKFNNKHFRLCFSVIKDVECFNGTDCQFAHSLEDFTPKVCKYDKDCKGVVKCNKCTLGTNELCDCVNDCTKLHPSFETKYELLKRLSLYPRQLVKS